MRIFSTSFILLFFISSLFLVSALNENESSFFVGGGESTPPAGDTPPTLDLGQIESLTKLEGTFDGVLQGDGWSAEGTFSTEPFFLEKYIRKLPLYNNRKKVK